MLLLVAGFALVSMVMGDSGLLYCDTDAVGVRSVASIPYPLSVIQVTGQIFNHQVPQICKNPVMLEVKACEKQNPSPKVLVLNLHQAIVNRRGMHYQPALVYTTVWCDPPYPGNPHLPGGHQLVAKARE